LLKPTFIKNEVGLFFANRDSYKNELA